MDEETQRKGVVIIHYNLEAQVASHGIIQSLGRILRLLPLRVASIHVCVNDMVVQAAASIASLLIGSTNTVRVRSHCGTDMEVLFELMTFGLDVTFPQSFPISPSGEVDISGHVQFLQQRRMQEAMDNQLGNESGIFPMPTGLAMNNDGAMVAKQRWNAAVIVPGELDIILGRGKGYQNHKGNVRYRHIVETQRPVYEALSTKKEKTKWIRDVVTSIYDGGGRFLRRDPLGRWIPIDQDMARDKVSHSFRNHKRLSQIRADNINNNNTGMMGGVASSPLTMTMNHGVDITERQERDAKRARNHNEA